jgi:hypothetical protein
MLRFVVLLSLLPAAATDARAGECIAASDCVVVGCCCGWHVMPRPAGLARSAAIPASAIPERCRVLCDCPSTKMPTPSCADGKCIARSSQVAPRRAPPAPTSSSRACVRDADCAFLPRCGCPPCTPLWRDVGNLRDLRRRGNPPCRPHRCRPCASSANWLGTRATCERGQCTAEDDRAQHASLPDPSRACTRDDDCEIRWEPCNYGRYRRPLCATEWKLAVNRATNARLRRDWADKKPHCPPPVGPCTPRGTRAVCVRGQCEPR